MKRITLLTDFGTADGYVAAMKGVIAQIAPSVWVEDATHQIAGGDVLAAAFAINRYWRLYPPGTVHVAVVDPGVGSARRALAVQADEQFLVAPDNGLLSFVLRSGRARQAVSIETKEFLLGARSATFHGRDVFAPAAAHLARGVALTELGPEVEDPMQVELPQPTRSARGVAGEVVYIDHFGNLITNIMASDAADATALWLEGRQLAFGHTYSDVPTATPVALVNSDDLVEVAVRDGSAAHYFGVGRGAELRIEY